MPGICQKALSVFLIADVGAVQHGGIRAHRSQEQQVSSGSQNPFQSLFSAVGHMGEKSGKFLKADEDVSKAKDVDDQKKASNSTHTLAAVQHSKHKHQPKAFEVAQPLHHVDNYANAQAITRTCNLEEQEDCKSMCRWLKMTDKETEEGKCPLFEWQLKSCSYVSPDQRADGEEAYPIDCAVNFLRTPVLAGDVGNYVHQLDLCISNLPAKVNRTCSLALDLVRGEVSDWKTEAGLVADAVVVRELLGNASSQAQVAIDTKSHEQEAIDALSEALGEAEKLPGHYLVEDVHLARGYLDQLGPIPAVRLQLSGALEDGKHAFETTNLFRVKEAMVWLQVAINKAERYRLGKPLPEARKILADLEVLKAALMDLKQAIFIGNMSVDTKSNVVASERLLNASMTRASRAGLHSEMPIAKDLFVKLSAMDQAVSLAGTAAARGKAILETNGNKGRTSLKDSVKELNSSITRALELGLDDNATVADATAVLDKVKWVKEAREALHRSTINGRKVLEEFGDILNDDAEEKAHDTLIPAITWANEVGLQRGVPVSNDLVIQLEAAEKAKESMAKALSLGNATLKAKSRIQRAIDVLKGAIVQNAKANVTAGTKLAREEIAMLQALLDAKASLSAAAVMTNESLHTRSRYEETLEALNTSIGEGEDVGLKPEVVIAKLQMSKLKDFAEADAKLVAALAERAPVPGPPKPAKLNDTVPLTVFNRTGYRVEDLPDVPNGADDGDNDFDEHIRSIGLAISRGKRKGVVDPEMKAQLAREIGMRDAYRMLREATEYGTEALDNKTHIEVSILQLTAALKEANEMGMSLGVRAGQTLLDKLNILQPARDELQASILQANVSMHTVSGMDASLVRLSEALELNSKLELFGSLPKARRLMAALMKLKKAFVDVKAAVMQGQIALKQEAGEEAAIAELNAAIEAADEVNLHKGLPVAVDLLNELIHMNAQHQQLQAAMDPAGER
jgi:hypothetical protein